MAPNFARRILSRWFAKKRISQVNTTSVPLNVDQPIATEQNIIMETNTVPEEKKIQNIPVIIPTHETFIEFEYLKNLIQFRLGNQAVPQLPEMPDVENWSLPLKDFLIEHHLERNPDVATLLLIALAPHARPELFDATILSFLENSNDYPEIGGVRGQNSRGFLPTAQTAVFLLAGNDMGRRKEIEMLLWTDQYLAKNKILWIEELPLGEPVMSGKIIMALDYIDLFLFGTSAPPHFSMSFPARKITTALTSEDIVMSEEVRIHFQNLKDWIENSPELSANWDTQERLRKGYRVLFYGPPGTGKTLTANVLGNETGKDVYKIDLSMVVSKYIGETEKNLELLFARAEDKNWILFFDEADAIFGKRTGVRDAHDKYANQEVSYLLQRIEDFNGLVILTTNMKNNIDEAFVRRFNDIVRFTIPNESERKEIWIKSFPTLSDFGDIPVQVKKYDLSGGNIHNAIHHASIQAIKKRNLPAGNAKDGKLTFYLDDVLDGIEREFMKEGRPFG